MSLGFLASHGGSSARAIAEACRDGHLDAHATVLVSNNSGAAARRWADRYGLATHHLSSHTHPDPATLDTTIRDTLDAHEVDVVVLSGYLRKLGPRTVARFRRRILNIHPAPLPTFGGAGMYGLRVHEVVLAAGLTTTEVTVHLVDDEYDHGPVIHRRPVPVLEGVDAAGLREHVQASEPVTFIEALRAIIAGRIDLDAVR